MRFKEILKELLRARFKERTMAIHKERLKCRLIGRFEGDSNEPLRDSQRDA